MLGADVVCHSKIIMEICSRAKYISSMDSISDIPGLRPQLIERLYAVIVNVPSVKR